MQVNSTRSPLPRTQMPKLAPPPLPTFVTPMLAKPGMPFDSDEHLFEVKWDGTRTLVFVDQDGYRLVNRRQADMTDRYPEFAFLRNMPRGTVLDGEMVVLCDGKPDFALLQSREHLALPRKIQSLAQTLPATLIVFDQLYENYKPLTARPLSERRERLRQLVEDCGDPHALPRPRGHPGPECRRSR
jgi:ATP-dependent DNA ligase